MKIDDTNDLREVACCSCFPPIPAAPDQENELAVYNLCGFTPDRDTPFNPPDEKEWDILYESVTWESNMHSGDVGADYTSGVSFTLTKAPPVRKGFASCKTRKTGNGSSSMIGYYDADKKQKEWVENRSWATNITVTGTQTTFYSGTEYDKNGKVTKTYSGKFDTTIDANRQAVVVSDPVWQDETLTFIGYDPYVSADSRYSGPTTYKMVGVYKKDNASGALNNAGEPTEAEWGFTEKGSGVSTITIEYADDGERVLNAQLTWVRYRIGAPEYNEPRSYYEAHWDEVYYPKTWTDWVAKKDAFDRWTDCEAITPGECGEKPDDPGDEPAGPVKKASHSFIWDGDTDDRFSDWFVMARPDSEGEVRVVNMMVKGYRDSRVGTKPTPIGETFVAKKPKTLTD